MTEPQPTPQWTALDFIVVAVLLLVILGVLASGLVKSCKSSFPSLPGPAVDAAVAPFSTPAGPLNDAHSAGLHSTTPGANWNPAAEIPQTNSAPVSTKLGVGPLMPGGRWARLRERCRWEVA